MRRETGTRQGDQPAIYLNDELPDPIGPPPPAYTTVWTDREYVYGPDYVDELVCQIDRTGAVMYAIQDANYNLMALTDASGAMLEQYTYDPYGTLRVAETYPITHAVNRIGHQGLFYDRLDGTMDDPSLEPNAVGLYYNRNRSYAPHLGRFMQRDPNATAIPVLIALSFNGRTNALALAAFDLLGHFADGANVYQYTRSNPVIGADPSGLVLDALSTLAAQTISWGIRVAYRAALAINFPGPAMRLVGGIFAAAGLYMMLANPEYQAVILAQPSAFNILQADLELLVSAGGALKALMSARLTGQLHHAISARVTRAINAHVNLRGRFTYRDPRYTSRARTLADHRGYLGTWHEDLDAEVVREIQNNPLWTEQDFLEYLNWRYGQPDLRLKFPMGLRDEGFFKK